jgi:hypothetical protein
LQVPAGKVAHQCVNIGTATTVYLGYYVNRSSTFGDLGCGVDTWYTDTACTQAWNYGDEFLTPPKVTGWQQVSTSFGVPDSTIRSFVVTCHLLDATSTTLFDRIYVRTTPGGF